jgi:hypothetical protein
MAFGIQRKNGSASFDRLFELFNIQVRGSLLARLKPWFNDDSCEKTPQFSHDDQ